MAQMATIETGFPSKMDRDRLRHAMRTASGSLEGFNDEDRWRWHAYDYAWRHEELGDNRMFSPIDKDGVWYDQLLIDQARHLFRKPPLRMREEPAVDIEARIARETWAHQHGCESFSQAITVGLQFVGRRAS